MTTIALCTPHCQWDPHRVKSFARLREQLGIGNERDEHLHVTAFKIFAEVGPVPNHVWSGKLFQWASEQAADWVVQIQDDVLPCLDFWQAARAALGAAGDAGAEVVSLFTIIPQAPNLAAQGVNWCTTTDWLVGPAWAVRPAFMREFVELRERRLRDGWKERIRENSLNEDTLLGLGAAALGRRIWHPLPGLVDHDVTVPSNYSKLPADHPFAKSTLTAKRWADLPGTTNRIEDLRDPAFWIPRNTVQGSRDRVVHFGCAYSFTAWNFARWCRADDQPYGGMPWDRRLDAIRSDTVRLEVAQ